MQTDGIDRESNLMSQIHQTMSEPEGLEAVKSLLDVLDTSELTLEKKTSVLKLKALLRNNSTLDQSQSQESKELMKTILDSVETHDLRLESKSSLAALKSFLGNMDMRRDGVESSANSESLPRLSSMEILKGVLSFNDNSLDRKMSLEVLKNYFGRSQTKPMTSTDSFRFQRLANCLHEIEKDISIFENDGQEDYGNDEEVVSVDNLDNLLDDRPYSKPPSREVNYSQASNVAMTGLQQVTQIDPFSQVQSTQVLARPPSTQPPQSNSLSSLLTSATAYSDPYTQLSNQMQTGMMQPSHPTMTVGSAQPQVMSYGVNAAYNGMGPTDTLSQHMMNQGVSVQYQPQSQPYSAQSQQYPNQHFTQMMMPNQYGVPVQHYGINQSEVQASVAAKFCLTKGCNNLARTKGYCKSHGGGRRCKVEGCTKSAQTGHLCIAHGGGKPCKVEGCPKTAQSRGLCKQHGGGVRCKFPGCTKSCQSGGFCRGHGGGKRCQTPGCTKWAQRNGQCAKHSQEAGNR